MGKCHQRWTLKRILRWIKKGRGAGRFGKYLPWFFVHEVPSRGIRGRIKGWKTQRIHHLLSGHEIRYFLILEWALEVIDIREQYPLLSIDPLNPVAETLEIARQLGYTHPRDNVTKCPVVFTTDFLITVRRGDQTFEIARTVKERMELEDPDVLKKFEIERVYWKSRGIDWAIVIAEDISKIVAQNVDWVHQPGLLSHPFEVATDTLEQVGQFLCPKLQTGKHPLAEMCLDCDEEFALRRGTTLGLIRFLIAKRLIPVDLSVPIDTSRPLALLRRNSACPQVSSVSP